MPRNKKGLKSTSSRHIRRLAREETARNIKEVILQSTLTASLETENLEVKTKTLVASTEQSSVLNSTTAELEVADQSATPSEEINEIEMQASHLYDIEVIESREVDQDNYDDIHQEWRSTEFAEENISSDAEEGILSNASSDYRYSDSDAESIDIDSDEDDNYPQSIKHDNFRNAITDWAKMFQSAHNALQYLLSILNEYTETIFPKNPRTLLNTPKSTTIISINAGQYYHLGLTNALKRIVDIRQ